MTKQCVVCGKPLYGTVDFGEGEMIYFCNPHAQLFIAGDDETVRRVRDAIHS